MPIDVSWFDGSKEIIFWEVSGAWTANEFHGAVSATKNLLYNSHEAKYTIVDATKVTVRPKENLPQLFYSALAGVELDVVVYVNAKGRRRLIELLVSIIFRTSPKLRVKKFRLAESIDEAVEILRL